MENPKSQQLSIIHWIGIFVLVGIVILVIFAESDSDRRARIEAEEKVSLAIKKNESASQTTRSDEIEIINLLNSVGKKISKNSESQAIVYVNSFRVLKSESPAINQFSRLRMKGSCLILGEAKTRKHMPTTSDVQKYGKQYFASQKCERL